MKSTSFLLDLVTVLLGTVRAVLVAFMLVISFPVYLFRFIVILYAKHFRPDLGEILSTQSSIIATDYFSGKVSRANIVATSRLRGKMSIQEFRDLITQRWLNSPADPSGKPTYRNFTQYPAKFCGFLFWKKAQVCSADIHVKELFGSDTLVTEEMLEEATEKLLNTNFPPNTSPWEFYLVSNFKDRKNPNENQILMVLKAHHCLADGFSITSAFIEGLGGKSLKSLQQQMPHFPKRSVGERIYHYGTLPIRILFESAKMMSHVYKNHYWAVPDHKKSWHQVYCKADPIPIATVKNIKNKNKVSFTSVIISSISAAISKSLEDSGLCEENMQLFMVLPKSGRDISETLNNNVTGAITNVPSRKFESPTARLKFVEELLTKTKRSAMPYLVTFFTPLLGSHFHFITKYLGKVSWVQIGLSNFPGIPVETDIHGRPFIDCGFIVGGIDSDTGLVVAVLSHGDNIKIEVCAERSIMSKQKLRKFVSYIAEEIEILDGNM